MADDQFTFTCEDDRWRASVADALGVWANFAYDAEAHHLPAADEPLVVPAPQEQEGRGEGAAGESDRS
jgi:hypothetical protein